MVCSLLVGLGNPGLTYVNTRHNIGRTLLFSIADKYQVRFVKFKNIGHVAWINNKKTALFYPDDYMNNSGFSVCEFINYYKIDLKSMCVFHDELELDVGVSKLKFSGSARGHNGIKHIMNLLGSDFWRLAVGIGHPKKLGLPHSVSDYVLSVPVLDEIDLLHKCLNTILDNVSFIVDGDFYKMKNLLEINRKK